MNINNKRKSLLYKSIFLTGLILMILEIKIFRITIIDFKIPLLIALIIGIFTTPLALKDFQKLFNYKNKFTLYFWTFIQSTVSWGFIFCSIFMFINYYASSDLKTKSYNIVDRSSLSGRSHHREERKPTFKINYNGKIKELVYSHKYYEDINKYQKVELKIKEGFFGFDVLIEQKLK